MGTYATIVLRDKTEANIKRVNDLLKTEKIFRPQRFNGIQYGAFITREQLKEDARYMNEDEEGKKQSKGLERPITVKTLSQFFWMKIGERVLKLSGGTDNEELETMARISEFCIENKFIDEDLSDNFKPEFIRKYLVKEMAVTG